MNGNQRDNRSRFMGKTAKDETEKSSNPFAHFAAGTSGGLKNRISHMSSSASLTRASTNAGGWIKTKKRGRDDDEIESDKKRVLEARRKSKSNNGNRTKQSKGHSKKNVKRNQYTISSDDDSMGDFLVSDDEEIEEYSSSNDDDNDEVNTSSVKLSSLERRKRSADYDLTKKKSIGGEYSILGTSSSDEDSKHILSRNSTTTTSSSSSSIIKSISRSDHHKPSRAPFRKNSHFNDEKKSDGALSSTDDDELETVRTENSIVDEKEAIQKSESRSTHKKNGQDVSSYFSNKGGSKFSKVGKKICSSNDSDSEDDIVWEKTKQNFSKKFTKKSSLKVLDDDSDLSPIKLNRQSFPATFSSSCEANVGKKRKLNYNKRNVLDDDDDDDDDGSSYQLETDTTQHTNVASDSFFVQDDFVEDEDEIAAIQQALKESKESYAASVTQIIADDGVSRDGKGRKILRKKKKKNPIEKNCGNKYTIKKKNEIVVLDNNDEGSFNDDNQNKKMEDLLQETSDEDEDGIEEEDYTEEAEKAGSVLRTANNLSKQVLRTMMTWCNSRGDRNSANSVADGGLPKGMIVDGALAMSTFSETNNCSDGDYQKIGTSHDNNNNSLLNSKSIGKENATNISNSTKINNNTETKKYISQEEMQRICPNLKLGDYQLIGVNWMALLHGMTCDLDGNDVTEGENSRCSSKRKKKSDIRSNVNGVLADEMGLGKTVQTIAFLAWLKDQQSKESKQMSEIVNEIRSGQEAPNRPHIIIVPASVLSNWKREFEIFCPSMAVVKYHGTMNERRYLKEKLRSSLPKATDRRGKERIPLDVVLTTFSYFSSEKGDDRAFLRKFDWEYMIVDEAHCLKNPQGARYKNMDNFRTQRRLLLTGTPVQNSPKELMSLLCFLMPLFTRNSSGFDSEETKNDGGAHMLQHFVLLEQSKSGQTGKTADVSDEDAYLKLKQLLAPFVLRRRKSDVLSQIMPPKTRKVEFVPFDEATRKVYDSILSSHVKIREGNSTFDETSHNHIFTALRKAANHPLLLRSRHKSPEEVEHLSRHLYAGGYFGQHETCTQKLVKKEIESFSDYDIHCAASELIEENHMRSGELSRYILEANELFCSPKMFRLKSLLPELVKEGHRMLIFSQWTRCLDLLSCLMNTLEFKFLRLDGQTSIADRQSLIDEFNNDPSIPVFLLSTRAGGMGINLTAADTCILHDLDYNPFNDLQAEDRCHRIGQKKPVTIIKMVTKGTVDEDIYRSQERKAKMNAAILENGTDSLTADSGKKTSASKNYNNSKKNEKQEINTMVKNAMDRFLTAVDI